MLALSRGQVSKSLKTPFQDEHSKTVLRHHSNTVLHGTKNKTSSPSQYEPMLPTEDERVTLLLEGSWGSALTFPSSDVIVLLSNTSPSLKGEIAPPRLSTLEGNLLVGVELSIGFDWTLLL